MRLEAPALVLTLGAIPPIAGLLAGWWGSLPSNSEWWIARFAIAGFSIGLLIDALFLRRWFRRRYAIPWFVWSGIFLFYSVGMFGLFMGMPAFNVALALPAGLVVGGKLAASQCDSDRAQCIVRRACIFATLVMTAVCAASGTIALIHPSTASELQHMLHLGFEVTQAHVTGLIIVGGSALLVLQWTLIAFVARRTWHGWIRQAASQTPGARRDTTGGS